MTDGQSYTETDRLIADLEALPFIDSVNLNKISSAARARRMVDLMFERAGTGSVSFGEISNSHPILLQSEDDFRSSLKEIDNNINAQIEIFRHNLDNYCKYGDCFPPYYPKRIAIILNKQKQGDRLFRFLRSYARIFTSRLESSVSNDLFPRALKIGAWFDPVVISWIDGDTGEPQKCEMRKDEIEIGGSYETTLRAKYCKNPVFLVFSSNSGEILWHE